MGHALVAQLQKQLDLFQGQYYFNVHLNPDVPIQQTTKTPFN